MEFRIRIPLIVLFVVGILRASSHVVTATPVSAPTVRAASSRHTAASALHPLVPKLQRSRIPVYLPSWLPRFSKRVYPSAMILEAGLMYSVYLTTARGPAANAFIAFWMVGSLEPRGPSGQRVPLGHGIVARFNRNPKGNIGPTISWAIGHDGYTMGGLAGGHDLIRAARSIVRVH